MATIESIPPFTYALHRKMGYGQIELDVLTVRGTFAWGDDEKPLTLAKTQRPIRWGETFDGPTERILKCVVASDGDADIGKLTTDIHVSGTLWSPSGKPQREWLSRIEVGTLSKTLHIHGPRQFRRGLLDWKLSEAEPAESVALDYRLAFGGAFYAEGLTDGDGEVPSVYSPANPAGCGWLPAGSDLKGLDNTARDAIKDRLSALRELPAPQITAQPKPIRSPYDRHPPEGWGPIARWWSPRVERQGTLDALWLDTRYPEWPHDFDARFHNSAHPDLIAPKRLQGDEPITLTQCIRHGRNSGDLHPLWRSRLPATAVYAMAELEGGRTRQYPCQLDTVGIDLDAREITLTWSTLIPPPDQPRHLLIGAMPLARMQQMRARPPARSGA